CASRTAGWPTSARGRRRQRRRCWRRWPTAARSSRPSRTSRRAGGRASSRYGTCTPASGRSWSICCCTAWGRGGRGRGRRREGWGWARAAAELVDRSRSPWDAAERRPSHAEKRKALQGEVLREEIRAVLGRHAEQEEFRDLTRRLLALAA